MRDSTLPPLQADGPRKAALVLAHLAAVLGRKRVALEARRAALREIPSRTRRRVAELDLDQAAERLAEQERLLARVRAGLGAR